MNPSNNLNFINPSNKLNFKEELIFQFNNYKTV